MHIITYLMILITKAYSIYTVENTVNDAINNSNLIKSQNHKIEQALNSAKMIKYSGYGMINIKTLYTNGDDPVYVFATKMKQGNFSMTDMMNINNPDSTDNLEIGVEAGIPIFTGFKIKNYQDIFLKNAKANEEIKNEIIKGITFKSIYSYLTASMYKALIKISSSAISSSEIELESARKLNEKGMIFGSDYYAALSIYEFIKKMHSEWTQSLKAEINSLFVLTSKNINEDDILSFEGITKLEVKDMDFYVNLAVASRNMLKAYDQFISIKQTQIDIAKKSILPEITAFASLSENSGSLSDFKTSTIYGLKINFPIGDPSYKYKIKVSEEDLKTVEEIKKDEIKKIEDEIRKTYIQLNSAKKSMEIAAKSVENAEKSVDLFKPLYRQGKQSIMEVLRAESNLLQARASYIEALFKYNLFYLKLIYESGLMNEDFVKEYSSKLK